MNYFKELLRFKDLLLSLSLREIKLRYQPSALGIAWAILQPLSLMLVFAFVFSRLARVSSDGVPYPVFVLCALIPWTFFANALSFGSVSLLNNAPIVSKVYFPREIVPLASAAAACLDYIVGMVFLFCLLAIYKVAFHASLWYLIPLLLMQLVFTLALVLLMSALIVVWRDLKYALPLVLQIWMFVTPVVYSWKAVPERFHWVRLVNPMVVIVDGYRRSILHQSPILFSDLVLESVIVTLMFVGSYAYFKRKEMTFADIL